MRKAKIRTVVVALMIFILIITTACSFRKSLSSNQLNTPRSITLIPYRAPTVTVTAGTYLPLVGLLVGGLVGLTVASLIDYNLTSDERAIITNHLNNSARDWNHTSVLANECNKILMNGSYSHIKYSSISERGILPGSEELIQKKPEIFSNNPSWNPWRSVGQNFYDTNHSWLKYKKDHPELRADWALEVHVYYTDYNGKVAYARILFKLVDTNTDEIIAGTVNYIDTEQIIAPTKKEEIFDNYKHAWENIAQRACAYTLKDMGLIAK